MTANRPKKPGGERAQRATTSAEPRGPAKAELREARVRRVMEIMAACEWRTGKSHAELASEWGIAEETVGEVAGEAARRLRALAGEHEAEIVGRMLAEIERIGGMALEATRATNEGVVYPAPDLRAALAAIELRAKLFGVGVTNVRISEEVAKLSNDELKRLYDAMRARVVADEQAKGGKE